MKIAWFHSHLLNTNSGGTRFVIDYASGLSEQYGHQVTLYCDIASSEAIKFLTQSGVKVVELDNKSTNSPIYWLTLPIRIWQKRRKLHSDILAYDVLFSSMFPMNWLIANFDIPQIQMCYEPFAFFYDHIFLQNFKVHQRIFFKIMKWFYQSMDKASTRKTDRVLTVNKTNIPKIKAEYGVMPDVVDVGIDTLLYRRAEPSKIEAIRKKHNGHPLLFHSTDLTGIKGTFPLLEIIRRLAEEFSELKLLITVYVNDPGGIKKLQRRITELELDRNVKYIGCLPRTELPIYYSAVDFVCQPSINQPTNWPLKEALLCATPIIGGAESEETLDFVNGVKIDLTKSQESYEKIKTLFSQNIIFSIDNTQLLANYSFRSCLDKFNKTIENTAIKYKACKS